VIAALAGGPLAVVGRLALAMLALQAAIGALNDVVDAPRDAGLKPGKPIPAGLVSPRAGALVAASAAALGVLAATPSGWRTVIVAVAILGIGAAYDLWLKGTPWSWLPFATGIPLLPVFAWLGTGQPLPTSFVALVPAAGVAGAGLAIGNALVDVERDRAAGVTSIAAHLGVRAAWRLMVALYVTVVAIAAVTALAGDAPPAALGGTFMASAVLLAGGVRSAAVEPQAREVGWRLQAVGVALLAAGWLAGLVLGQGSA
jgi:4-hydroxybenzoate polyprenyltransferase